MEWVALGHPVVAAEVGAEPVERITAPARMRGSPTAVPVAGEPVVELLRSSAMIASALLAMSAGLRDRLVDDRVRRTDDRLRGAGRASPARPKSPTASRSKSQNTLTRKLSGISRSVNFIAAAATWPTVLTFGEKSSSDSPQRSVSRGEYSLGMKRAR